MRLAALLLLALGTCLSPALALAAPLPGTFSDSLPVVHISRLTAPFTLDGALDDPAWQVPPTLTRLTQYEPHPLAASSESTWVWLAHDADGIVFAARCWDSRPDSVLARLARRDADVVADFVEIWLDPFHDHRNGYYFTVGAAGVQWDGVGYNDSGWDGSWDGVWSSRARRDDRGWTVEMRIPFDQLRFPPGREQVWGVNVHRYLARRAEDDFIAYRLRNQSGTFSRSPHLVGLVVERRPRSLELLPYVTGKAEYVARPVGDPLHDGSRLTPGAGGDARMSLGNNLTLNATVNPDFGQVEMDPAVVNLSDTESFFQEKRPFFTENARIFGFGNEGAAHYWGFGWPEPRFFYSRRIGAAPRGRAPGGSGYVDAPITTRILGAAKVTGKLTSGLDAGTLHAVTGREHADFVLDGSRGSLEVEPLTYRGVARVLQQRRGGSNGLGLMTTLVQRDLDRGPLADALNRRSLTTGLDGWHFLGRGRLWVLSGWAAMSRVEGTTARMRALQSDPRHYLQRPDREHDRLDPEATSLTGYGARVWLDKVRGNLISNSAVGFMDPRFDVNDLGFQTRADIVTAHTGLQYRFTRSNPVQRVGVLGEVLFASFDFDGDRTDAGYWQGYDATFANDWTLSSELMFVPRVMNHRRTRGGPLMEERPGTYWSLTVQTPGRARLAYGLHGDQTVTPASHTDYWNLGPTVMWKPVSNLSLEFAPTLSRALEDAQFVQSVPAPGDVPADLGGRRHVFARMDQTTWSADVRLEVSFSTTLTLQTYLQPLISAARFSDFKELARAGSFDFVHYGAMYDPASSVVSPAGGTPFPLGDPSFNQRSLRGNAVLRWEYRPGSVLYFVWTQQRTDEEYDGALRFRRSVRSLFDAHADDVFMVKLTYHLAV